MQTSTAKLFEQGLRRIRQKLVSNTSLEEILDTLIGTVEEQYPDIIGSVLLLDREKKCLRHGSASSLPSDYCQAIDGLLIGPEVGSCGTAAFIGKSVVVEDISTHPYWEPYRELALKAGVHSCWSQPIFSADNKVLGTFALYYREPKTPTQNEFDLLEAAAEIAGIAIEMKWTDTALRRQQDLTQLITENTTAGLIMVDKVSGISYVNSTAITMFGYSKEEMLGRDPHDLLHYSKPDGTPYPRSECKLMTLLLAGEHLMQTEEMFISKDGSFIPVLISATPLCENGEVRGAVYEVRDLTEEKRSELSLIESEERFRAMADNIPNLAWMADSEGWIFWYNKRWYEYTGTTPAQMEGWGWQSVHDPNELPRVLFRWKESITTGESFSMVFPLKGADGFFRPFLTRVEPVRDSQGRVTRWFGTNTDISDYQRTKEALAESERRYRLLVSGITDYAIFMENPQGIITSWDEGAQRLFGYTAEEIVGQPFSKFHLPEDIQANLMARELEIATREGRVETEGLRIRKDGSYFRAKAVLRAVYDESNNLIGFAKIVQDITEQKKAEEQVLESHNLMSMVSYAQGLFFSNENIYDMFEDPLQQLLDFTRSEYGFIGEILKDEHGEPYLKCNFITNIAWDEETKKLWEESRKTGFEFHKLDNLFGHAIRTGEVVISNDTANDARRSPQGRPQGHPPLNSFLGMPFQKNGVMIGLVGIANRPGGYDTTLVEKLQPFLDACANIIAAYRNQMQLKSITEELQKSEAQLRKSEEYFRATFQASVVPIFIIDLNGKFIRSNDACSKVYGYSEEEFKSLSIPDITHPDDIDKSMELVGRLIKGEIPSFVLEKRYLRKNNLILWSQSSVSLVHDDQGKPQYLIAVVEDMTERKRIDLILHGQKQALEQAVNGESLNVILDTIAIGAEAQSVSGLKASILLIEEDGKHLRHGGAPSLPQWYNELVDGVAIGPDVGTCGRAAYINQEVVVTDMTNDPNWAKFKDAALSLNLLASWSTPIFSSKGRLLGTFGVYYPRVQEPTPQDREAVTLLARTAGLIIEWHYDIKEREKANDMLIESEERFRLIANASPSFVWTLAPDGTQAYLNDYGLKFFGTTLEEFLENSWPPYLHPDDVEGATQALQEAISTNSNYRFEHRVRRWSGEYRWVLSTAAPSFLPDGRVYGYVGSSIDITDRKQAEEDLLNYSRLLERSNKELEEFATIASHDLQAPLRKVMTFSDMLHSALNGQIQPDAETYIERIQKSTGKMQGLITDLLALSRITRHNNPFKTTDLKEVIEDALEELDLVIQEKNAVIEVGPLCTIEADPSQMKQIFNNLIGNSLKFSRDSAPANIQISAHTLKKWCEITIKDNGIGFKPELSERIFKAFERGHGNSVYPGTGIGLTIVRKIVERHSGTITASGIPNEGATFVIRLPLKQEKPNYREKAELSAPGL